MVVIGTFVWFCVGVVLSTKKMFELCVTEGRANIPSSDGSGLGTQAFANQIETKRNMRTGRTIFYILRLVSSGDYTKFSKNPKESERF